jgi:hypothetical protein
MKAYCIDHFGSVDGVLLRSRDDPRPGRREILVRVRATSLNYRDLMVLKGGGTDDYGKRCRRSRSAVLRELRVWRRTQLYRRHGLDPGLDFGGRDQVALEGGLGAGGFGGLGAGGFARTIGNEPAVVLAASSGSPRSVTCSIGW